jgi:hypothetical protein
MRRNVFPWASDFAISEGDVSFPILAAAHDPNRDGNFPLLQAARRAIFERT